MIVQALHEFQNFFFSWTIEKIWIKEYVVTVLSIDA